MGLINREPTRENVAAPTFSVSAILRETRLRLGEDLNTAAQTLRIRAVYLEAIEAGRFDDLPGVPYVIGFIRSYADHLGLNGDDVVTRFKEEAVGGLVNRQELVFPSPVSEGRVPGVWLTLLALLLAVAAYGGWYYLSSREAMVVEMVEPIPEKPVPAPPIQAPPGQTPSAGDAAAPAGPAAAPAAEVVPPAEAEPEGTRPPMTPPTAAPAAVERSGAGTPTPEPESVGALPAVPADLPSGNAGRVYGQGNVDSRVTLEALADAWIQVRDQDGGLLLTRLLRAGDVYRVPDQAGLTMMTGSAGGLKVLVDGKEAPKLGDIGVVRRDISLDPDSLLAGR